MNNENRLKKLKKGTVMIDYYGYELTLIKAVFAKDWKKLEKLHKPSPEFIYTIEERVNEFKTLGLYKENEIYCLCMTICGNTIPHFYGLSGVKIKK